MDKTCACCKHSKSIDEFGVDKHRKDGRNTRCILCRRAANAQWRKDNPEKSKAIWDRYYTTHRDIKLERKRQYRANLVVKAKDLQYSKQWRINNPERVKRRRRNTYIRRRAEILAWHSQYRKRNRAKYNAYQKRWELKSPEKARASRLARMERRRARLREAPGNYTSSQILAMLIEQAYCCFACNAEIAGCYSIDHIIPLSKGGSNDISNIQLLCKNCNSSKGDRDPMVWAIKNRKRIKEMDFIQAQVRRNDETERVSS